MGVILCALYLLVFLISIAAINRHGWYDDRVVIALTVTIIGLMAWIYWEFKAPEPMLDLHLFLNFKFMAVAIVSFMVSVGLYSSTYVLPLYLQNVAKFMPTDAGLIMAPAGLMMVAIFLLAGYLADRISARVMILVGLFIFAFSNYPMTFVDGHTPWFTW